MKPESLQLLHASVLVECQTLLENLPSLKLVVEPNAKSIIQPRILYNEIDTQSRDTSRTLAWPPQPLCQLIYHFSWRKQKLSIILCHITNLQADISMLRVTAGSQLLRRASDIMCPFVSGSFLYTLEANPPNTVSFFCCKRWYSDSDLYSVPVSITSCASAIPSFFGETLIALSRNHAVVFGCTQPNLYDFWFWSKLLSASLRATVNCYGLRK